MIQSLFVLVASTMLAAPTFAASPESVHITGSGGRVFDSANEVKDMKTACALANTVAEDQASAACATLSGEAKGVVSKSVIPVTNTGGHSGSCRVSLDLLCEVSF